MQKISPKVISNKIAVSRSSIKYPNKEEQKTPFNYLLGKTQPVVSGKSTSKRTMRSLRQAALIRIYTPSQFLYFQS